MTNPIIRWTALLRQSDKPAYLAIADAINDDIQSGKLSANQVLPPLRSLADALDLNFSTVARGYAEAQRRGLIDARAGRGTRVRAQVANEIVPRPATATVIDMSMNMPPEPQDRALIQRMRDSMAALSDEADFYDFLRYREVGGSMADREAGAQWLSRHIPGLSAARVLVCPGAQSALLALFSALARPGDTIACEAVTYPGVKGLAAQLGLKLHGLPADDEGIEPEAFAALCASEPPKALYCNPTLLNPTTAIMSQARRERVAEIARSYNVPIIEDDPYGCLAAVRPQALAALAPELTFHISGLAKILGAGLRVGYIVTPNARYAARVSAVLRTTVIMPPAITLKLATRWLNDGIVRAMTLAVREESRARQTMAAQILGPNRFISKPEAFHLWLAVPEPASRIEFVNHLRTAGVSAVVSDTFTVSGPAPEALRICLGGAASREECRHALEIIADALEHLPL